MPRIIDNLVTAEPAWMISDQLAIQPDHDPLGISVQLNRSADRAGLDAVAVRWPFVSGGENPRIDGEQPSSVIACGRWDGGSDRMGSAS
jgi:hypothetical protein